MRRSRFSLLLVMTVALAALLCGCAKPHEAEQSAAKAAMEAGRALGADRYADADYGTGRRLWNEAEDRVSEKNYQEAKRAYADARAAFEKAAGGVEAGRRAMVPEAAAAVVALEAEWRSLESTAKRVEGRMGNRKLWEADRKNFLEGLKAAKEMVDVDPAGAKAKAVRLTHFLGTYGEYFKQLAAGPKKPPAPRKREHPEE